MTGRTHDLAAFTCLTYLTASQPLVHMSLATAAVALGVNMIGGIFPDIDQPTGALWHKLPVGTILGKIMHPFFGAHRSISHSLLGAFLAALLAKIILNYTSSFLLVDNNIVFLTFMLGIGSHLVADTFTKEGVPWLFPIPIRFGVPPLKALRITTGKLVETSFVFPGLLVLNGYLIYTHYSKFVNFLTHYITR
jgi:inner membrane protein